MKTVHSFDYSTGVSLGPVNLTDSDRSPLEPNEFLIPGNCVEVEPPVPEVGQFVAWESGQWKVKDIPTAPPPEPPDPLTGNSLILSQIAEKESTITQRRLREAVLGIDGGWLAAKDTEIAALRDQLLPF